MNTFYEFFAGGGMARAGLGQHWQCLLANDICAAKGRSYAANWGDDHLIVRDIYDINASELPAGGDLAWGSFPCQDLSLAGAGLGLQGERSGAFWGFWKIIQALNKDGRKPKIVVIENVFGALTSHQGQDFELIANAVTKEGYTVGAMVIDAVYFVPQSRPRLFIIGVDSSLAIPTDMHAATAHPAWHPAALIRAHNRLSPQAKASWRWWCMPVSTDPAPRLDDLMEADPVGVQWHTQEETEKLLNMMSPLHRRKVMAAQGLGRVKVGMIYKRTRNGVQRAEVRFDGIAGCLRTPSGGSSRQTVMIVQGSQIKSRLISPREAARLMGLPESYKLPTRYNEAYKLLGDGVAVPVVTHLEKHIFSPLLQLNRAILDSTTRGRAS